LYKFYLKSGQYEKAYSKLQKCALFLLEIPIKLKLLGGLNIPKWCVIESNDAPFTHTKDNMTGKIISTKRPTLLNTLYEHASKMNDTQEQLHLYRLAATQGHPKSIIALFEQNIVKFNQNRLYIKQMILFGKSGDHGVTGKLTRLAVSADPDALMLLFEDVLLDRKSGYSISILEEATVGKSPMILCTLGLCYKKVSVRQDNSKSLHILKQIEPEIKKLAEAGCPMAQFQLGSIYKLRLKNSVAIKWYIKSAPYCLPALHEMGIFYQTA
jgi:TPR repeat protein